MSEPLNEQELVQYIAGKTNVDTKRIMIVLKHEEAFINHSEEDEIDSDDLVDYVLSQRDVNLDELTVETILDLEMDYLMEKGLAGYID